MDDEFQHVQTKPPLLAGGEISSDGTDEAYLNGFCGGLSFRTLLTYGSFDPAAETQNPLKMKIESSLFAIDEGLPAESPPYNFFCDMMPSSVHHQLPSLLSYEQPQNSAAVVEPPILNPRAETSSYRKQLYRRQQKQRLSDKTRCLQKLLPLDDKMDMAKVLEEAYKYIKFLQAQVRVLESMPCEGNTAGAANIRGATNIGGGGGGDLGILNRQQLLQVVVSSPVAQTKLYSKGCCLYSMEQLILLKNNAEKYHQMMLDSSVNPNYFLS